MVSPSDISSVKEHSDVILVLFLLSLGGLLALCLYIIKTHRDNDIKTVLLVEQHELLLTELRALQVSSKLETHTRQIAKLYTALSAMITAYNMHHPDQKIDLPK